MTLPLSDLAVILPELIVVTSACLVLGLDPITPASKKDALAWLSLGSLVICLGFTASQMGGRTSAFSDLVIIDPYACFWKLLLYLVTGLTILLSFAYLKEEHLHLGEYYGFILLALSGMMVMVSAADLLTIYLGTELMSLSLYVMAGLKRSEPRSLEASAKYFVLGAFSSGLLLYGISLLFGAAGATRLSAIAIAVAERGLDDPILLLAMILLAVGFGFKLAVVPFHMWTPDVYEGAPTSVTAFMAVASKAASFGAFLRVFVEGLGGLKANWQPLFLAVCLATLVLGNVVAIVQTNIKRMLAYSSIAHAGYALIGLVAAGRAADGTGATGLASVMLYLAVYAFMTLGAFAVVAMLRKGGLEARRSRISRAWPSGSRWRRSSCWSSWSRSPASPRRPALSENFTCSWRPSTAGWLGWPSSRCSSPPCRPTIICAWSWSCTCGSPSPAPLRCPAWPPRRRCPSSWPARSPASCLWACFPILSFR